MGRLMQFNEYEKGLVQKAKDLESDARDFRKRAEAARSMREAKTRLDETLRKARQDKLNMRVETFVKRMAADLSASNLKLMDSSGFDGPQTKIYVLDNESTDVVQVEAVNGLGFRWSLMEQK